MNSVDELLIKAIKTKGHNEVKSLLEKGENINVNLKDRYGNTALMVAARTRNTEIKKLLLEKGGRSKYYIFYVDSRTRNNGLVGIIASVLAAF